MSIPLRLENDRSDEFANFLETKRKREEDERRRQNILRSTRSQAQAINQRAKTARIDSRRRAMNVNSPMTPQFMRDQMNARAAQKEAVASARASGLPNNRLSAVPMNAPATQPVATAPAQPAAQPVAAPLERTPEQEAQLALDLEDAAIQNRRNYTASLMGPLPPTDYLSEGARQMLPQKPAPPYEEIDPLIIDNANQTADLVDDLVRVLSDPDEAPVDEEVIPANMMMSSYPDFFTDPAGHLDAREEAQDLGFISSLLQGGRHAFNAGVGLTLPSEEEQAKRVQELIDAYTPKDTDRLGAADRSRLSDAFRKSRLESGTPSSQAVRELQGLQALMDEAERKDFEDLMYIIENDPYLGSY